MIKCWNFHTLSGYLSSNGSSIQTNRLICMNFMILSPLIDKVSFKSNSMSLGLVVFEKLFAE